MLPIDEIRFLHRHGDEWHEMRPAHHDAEDHDVERQLVKGARVFRCSNCDAEFGVADVEAEDETAP